MEAIPVFVGLLLVIFAAFLAGRFGKNKLAISLTLVVIAVAAALVVSILFGTVIKFAYGFA